MEVGLKMNDDRGIWAAKERGVEIGGVV